MLLKYLRPVFSPDDAVAIAEPPPVVVDPPTDPAVAADPPAPSPEPAQKMIPLKVLQDRVSSESTKRLEAERQRDEALALAQRLQQGKEPPNPAAASAPRAPAPDSQEFRTAVQREAAQQRLAEARNEIVTDGYKFFGKGRFDEVASILASVGATGDDFIADVLASDRANAAKTLAAIAADPEKAALLASMDSRQRIAELTRMSIAAAPKADPAPSPLAPPAPKTVSKAPPPAPKVDPSATKVLAPYSDELSDEEFTRQFNERQKGRAGARR